MCARCQRDLSQWVHGGPRRILRARPGHDLRSCRCERQRQVDDLQGHHGFRWRRPPAEVRLCGLPVETGDFPEHRRLCAPERGRRLELPGFGPRRRDDGPLRPHESVLRLPSQGKTGTKWTRHWNVSNMTASTVNAADRRALRRAEEARLSRPRLGPRGSYRFARRALHGHRCDH